MKKSIFYLFILFSTCINAQDTLGRWSVGFSGGIDRSYSSIQFQSDPVSEKVWDSLEMSVWRSTAGLKLSYRIKNNLEAAVGFYYTDRGYRIDTILDAGLHNLKFHYRYFELPIGVNYSIPVNDKNNILFGLAYSLRILVDNKLYYQKIGQTAEFEMNTSANNKVIPSNVMASLGIRRIISQKSNIDLILNSNQSFSNISDGDSKRVLNSIGLHIVLSTQF
jgi:hypothetical protein